MMSCYLPSFRFWLKPLNCVHDDVIKWKQLLLSLNKWLNKQSRCRWFEAPSRLLGLQCCGCRLCRRVKDRVRVRVESMLAVLLCTWASWRLKSPAFRLFIEQLVQADDKGNLTVLHCWPFVRWKHWWLVDPPVTARFPSPTTSGWFY